MPPGARETDSDAERMGTHGGMGFLWGIVKTVALVFGVIIALLLILDSALFANLLRKNDT